MAHLAAKSLLVPTYACNCHHFVHSCNENVVSGGKYTTNFHFDEHLHIFCYLHWWTGGKPAAYGIDVALSCSRRLVARFNKHFLQPFRESTDYEQVQFKLDKDLNKYY